jgi:hypothetical protein
MKIIFKNFTEKSLLFLISFFIIFYSFINFSYKHLETYKINDENLLEKISYIELKNNINQNLTSDLTYEHILSKNCEITGNMHDRHKVRWVKSLFLKNIYQISEKLNPNLPFYVNIILHSLLIFLSLIFLNQTFPLKNIYIIFFLLYVTFVFQFHLGEYSYSIFEMFFASSAIYASKKKNILLFFFIILMAVLNRESGFIIILTWLIFNQEFKKILIFCFIICLSFLIINYESINCIINPKFFVPLDKQEGQAILSEFSSLSIFSKILVGAIYYIIPIGLIFYGVFKNNTKNKVLIIMSIIYLLVFLFATPIFNLQEKLIILPFIILSFNLYDKKVEN